MTLQRMIAEWKNKFKFPPFPSSFIPIDKAWIRFLNKIGRFHYGVLLFDMYYDDECADYNVVTHC